MAATTLKLPDALKTRLVALAQAQGKSPHAYMIEALEEQAARAERRRDYLAAADSALGDYQRTGIAYAMEDVEQYVVALAEGRKAAKPKPSKRSQKG
jgi:predicted transcriptional regulator